MSKDQLVLVGKNIYNITPPLSAEAGDKLYLQGVVGVSSPQLWRWHG